MAAPGSRSGGSRPFAALAGIAAAVAVAGCPLAVWFLADRPRLAALVLLLLLLPALLLRLRRRGSTAARGLAAVPVATALAATAAALLDAQGGLLLAPVAVNAVLLLTFGATLRRGSLPMIERFARLREPALTPAQQAWCRRWTWIWCLFFVGNGGTALLLALQQQLQWWAIYNGLIAYLLIGALLLTEWLLRRRRFAPGAVGER